MNIIIKIIYYISIYIYMYILYVDVIGERNDQEVKIYT